MQPELLRITQKSRLSGRTLPRPALLPKALSQGFTAAVATPATAGRPMMA
jgi:hypothetical protein